ncbi:MAG: leucine-rich repeat protein [Phocaeicola sp.]|nr:leucine-rich repeat protein [Phocaeicola sp.]
MNRATWILSFWAFCLLACNNEREDVTVNAPTILIYDAILVTGTSATVPVEVISHGSKVMSCTIHYGTAENALNFSSSFQETEGEMQITLTSLAIHTTYYYQVVVSSGYSEIKSDIKSFTTDVSHKPEISPILIKNQNENGIELSFTVINDGEKPVTNVVVTYKAENEDLVQTLFLDLRDDNEYTFTLTSLYPDINYEVTAYIQNESDTSDIQTFTFTSSNVVKVTSMGILNDLIPLSIRPSIKSIKIIGDINADDWNVITYLLGFEDHEKETECALEYLDLSEANIVGGKQIKTYKHLLNDNIIPENGFQFAKALKTFVIPNKLVKIEGIGLLDCYLEEYVTSDQCENYKAIDGVLYTKDEKAIVSYPMNRPYAASYVISDTVEKICAGCFYGAKYVGSITIPSSLKSLEPYGLSFGCAIPSVKIPSSSTSIGEYGFSTAYLIEEIDMECSVDTIPHSFFRGCSGLKKLILGENIKVLVSSCLEYCSALESIYCKSYEPPTSDNMEKLFNNVSKKNCTIYVPRGCLTLYQSADGWKDFKHIVEME